MAAAEFAKLLDGLARVFGGGVERRHQSGNRPAMLGDHDLLAARDPVEQGRQMCLGFKGADDSRHEKPVETTGWSVWLSQLVAFCALRAAASSRKFNSKPA